MARYGLVCIALLASAWSFVLPPNVPALTDENFEGPIKDGIWFVAFYASWDGHCQRALQQLSPLVDEGKKYDRKWSIADIGLNEGLPVVSEVELDGYPTLALFENGKLMEKYSGSRQAEIVARWLDMKEAELKYRHWQPPEYLRIELDEKL